MKHIPSKRFHSQEEEFTIAKYANITPSSVPFSFNEDFSNQLCTIAQALEKDLYETVDIKAKVLKKQEYKQTLQRMAKKQIQN